MKTKKITMLALCTAFILMIAAVAYGGIADSANLQITIISQEPDPAEPGGVIDLRFKVENVGGGGTDDIIFEIVPEFPFSVYSGSAQKNIGSMQAYQNGEEGIIVYYKLKVNEDAVEGNNYIDIRYKYGEIGSTWRYVKDFVIRVRTDDIVLLIDEVKSIPALIPPGQKAQLTLKIKNMADSLIKDLKVKIDLSSDNLPFVPIGSTTEKKIYQLNSKEETVLVFDIMAMADADSQAYKIPLEISYYDLAGTQYEKSDIIGLIVGAEPDLYVGVDSSEIYGGQKAGKVTIRMVNKGVTDMKFLNVILKESKNYEIVSPAEVYIGNIDSDDYETVDYDLYVKTRDDVVELPLKLEYMDANNNQYSIIETVQLRQYSSAEAKKYGLAKEKGIGGLIIFIIVVGGFGYYVWKQKKKGKKIFGKW